MTGSSMSSMEIGHRKRGGKSESIDDRSEDRSVKPSIGDRDGGFYKGAVCE